jgi:predicted dehydrogenase
MWIIVTMDNGVVITIGAGWNLPPTYPNFSTTWIEIVGTEGALFLDDSHRDIALTTNEGNQLPLSTMPGEAVGHVFAGPMERETQHFLECVAYRRKVLVTPHEARPGDGGLPRRRPVSGTARAGQAVTLNACIM